MANLNLRGIDQELKKRLKVGAASSGKTLVEYCEVVLRFGFWCADGGAHGPGVTEIRLGEEAVDSKKKSDVSGASGEGAELGRGKNPKRVGRVPEEMVESPVVVGIPEGVELPAGFGLPGPGFEGVPENTAPWRPASQLPQGVLDAAYGAVPPKVPDEAVAFAKHLRDKVEAFTGADPQILNQTEKPHARTLQGVKAAEAHRDAKIKKIASVPPSPTPGKSQEKKNVQTQSASKETPKNRKEDQPSQRQSTQAQSESQPPAGTGQRLDSNVYDFVIPYRAPEGTTTHDPKTCKLYGCLMCKAAKEGQ